MSWKATSFVKELVKGINATEKLVLLVLADYHHTQSQAAWPSVKGLAEDCLMSERNCQRVLSNLAEKNFIRRTIGKGRGKYSAYWIVGLDPMKPDDRKGDNLSETLTEKVTEKATKSSLKGDTTGNAIRKERVEPVFEPVKEELSGFQKRQSREKQDRVDAAKKRGMA